MYSTVSVGIGISWCVQYCVSKARDLSQVHTLAFRRYMYAHQVEEAECPLSGANDQCASPTTCPTRSRHRSRQRQCQNCQMSLLNDTVLYELSRLLLVIDTVLYELSRLLLVIDTVLCQNTDAPTS